MCDHFQIPIKLDNVLSCESKPKRRLNIEEVSGTGNIKVEIFDDVGSDPEWFITQKPAGDVNKIDYADPDGKRNHFLVMHKRPQPDGRLFVVGIIYKTQGQVGPFDEGAEIYVAEEGGRQPLS